MKFFKKIKYVIDVNKAFSKNEEREYKYSLSLLEKQKDFANKNKMNIPDFFILYAENLAMLKRYKESENYLTEAIGALEATTVFNSDEINYLKAYIISWINFLKSYKQINNNKFEELVNSEFEFDLDNVRKSLKINFPQNFEIFD